MGAWMTLVPRVPTVIGATGDGLPGSDRARTRAPSPDAFIATTARLAGATPVYSFDADFQRHGIATASP